MRTSRAGTARRDDARQAALDQARADVGAAREDIARLALDAERVPLPERRPFAMALREAVRALDAAEEHLAVAVIASPARRREEGPMTLPDARRMVPLTTDKDREP